MVTFVNRAKMTTATTGTGTITLNSALTGYQSFAAAGVANGNTVSYVIEDGADWEIGSGAYTAVGTTLSRTPTQSSNAGAAITLSGNAVVYVSVLASDIDAKAPLASPVFTGNVSVGGDLTVGGTIDNATLEAYKEKITTVGTVSTSTYSIDTSLSNLFDITLGANVTFTFTNPPASGFSRPVVIILRQDGTGSRTATFTGAKYTEGQLPTLSTGASDIDVLTFFTIDSGTSWFGTFAMANVS